MKSAEKAKPLPSISTPALPSSAASTFKPSNPYARDSSRRAIACVSCAKAKTRCDKALPSCSRCLTKGIKCDPRSTRRTTDTAHYRTVPTKRPLTSAKRFPNLTVLPSTSSPSKQRPIMRAPSHIDFRTAVKMSQQKALISSTPNLMPLPTYQSHIVDECYSYTVSPEPELRFTPELEGDGFWGERGATPQTPQFHCIDPVAAVGNGGYGDQSWAGDGLVPVGLGFDGLDLGLGLDMVMSVDINTCASHFPPISSGCSDFTATTNFIPANNLPLDASLLDQWPNLSLPTPIPNESVEKNSSVTLDSGIVMQNEWTQGQDSYVDMGMVTSAPYVPHGGLGQAGVWEDVFMHGGLRF